MALNRKTFFAYARRAPFGGRLSTAQLAGLDAILDACRRYAVTDLRWIAYILATAFHETGARMQPVRETFAASDAQAIARLEKAWREGKLTSVSKPYWRSGWFGRGYAQVTHLDNYQRMGSALGLDLVKSPALMLESGPAARAIVVGMRDGLFAKGQTLGRYFPLAGKVDPEGARRIVNGSDKKVLIAGYYAAFLDALEAADDKTPQPADVTAAAAEPDDVPPTQSGSVGTIAVSTLGAGAASVVAGISNPWALGALALLLVAAGVGAWLLLSGRVTINRSKALV